MSFRMNYRTGNVIGFVVQKIVVTWNAILRRVGTEILSTYILSYSWYNFATGMVGQLRNEETV